MMRQPGGRLDSGTWTAILALATTQVIGWGTTFYTPAILVRPMSADLGLPKETIFGGVTIMLLVSAALGPWLGSVIDRHGARGVMALGSLAIATALLVLSQATGLAAYACAWLLMGVATPMALSQAAVAALARIARGRARRALGTLLVFTSLSSTVFWPLTAWLEARLGWRDTFLVYAGINVFACLPLHALLRPTLARTESAVAGGAVVPKASPALKGRARQAAFALIAFALSCAGFITWGLPLLAIELLRGLGHSASVAILVGSLIGPATVCARVAEMLIGHRFSIVSMGVAATSLMLLALLALLAAGAVPAAAVGFALGYGLAAGTLTVVRVVAPLQLFGPGQYGAVIGRLGVPQNIVFAFSPTVFAVVMREFGPAAVLSLALGAGVLALAAMLVLARIGGPRRFTTP